MRASRISIAAVAALAALLSACGSSSNGGLTQTTVFENLPLDVGFGANGCNMANWAPRASERFLVTLTQQGTSVSASATDVSGVSITSSTGTSTFTGTLIGDDLTITAPGIAQETEGSCTFTTNAAVQAKVDGTKVHGTLTYTRIPVTASPACASFERCQSVRTF